MIQNNQKHRTQTQWGGRETAAPLGAAPLCSLFQVFLCDKYVWIFLIHSSYIPYIFPRYVPCISPCVFLYLLIYCWVYVWIVVLCCELSSSLSDPCLHVLVLAKSSGCCLNVCLVLGRRLRQPPHWVCVSDHFISQIFIDIPYLFPIYSIFISQICSMYFPLCVS